MPPRHFLRTLKVRFLCEIPLFWGHEGLPDLDHNNDQFHLLVKVLCCVKDEVHD